MSTAVSDSSAVGAAIESRDIATDDVIETFPSMRAEDVAAVIAAARRVTPIWHRIGFARRRMHLLAWAANIVAHRDYFVTLIERECGKPSDDAYMELVIAVEHIRWAATHAKRVLRRHRVLPTALMSNYSASVDYEPF